MHVVSKGGDDVIPAGHVPSCAFLTHFHEGYIVFCFLRRASATRLKTNGFETSIPSSEVNSNSTDSSYITSLQQAERVARTSRACALLRYQYMPTVMDM